MMNTVYKNKTLNEYKKERLIELTNIKLSLVSDFLNMEELDDNLMIEINEAIEELDVYINFIQNMDISIFEKTESIIGKLYLLLESPRGVLKVIELSSERFTIPESLGLTESKLVSILLSPFVYRNNKAFQFAREMYLRKKYNVGYKSNWKSSSYVIEQVFANPTVSKKNKKKVKK